MEVNRESSLARALEETKKWLLNSFVAWIFVMLAGAAVSAVFIPSPANDILLYRAIYGLIGGVITIILIVGITYLVQLIVAPYKQRNEARHLVDSLQEEKIKRIKVEKKAFQLGMLVVAGTSVETRFKSALNNGITDKTKWPIKEFNEWIAACLEFFKTPERLEDVMLLIRNINVDPQRAVLEDYIKACADGIERIEKIIERYRS